MKSVWTLCVRCSHCNRSRGFVYLCSVCIWHTAQIHPRRVTARSSHSRLTDGSIVIYQWSHRSARLLTKWNLNHHTRWGDVWQHSQSSHWVKCRPCSDSHYNISTLCKAERLHEDNDGALKTQSQISPPQRCVCSLCSSDKHPWATAPHQRKSRMPGRSLRLTPSSGSRGRYLEMSEEKSLQRARGVDKWSRSVKTGQGATPDNDFNRKEKHSLGHFYDSLFSYQATGCIRQTIYKR